MAGAVQEGLFGRRPDGSAYLIGGRCGACTRRHFPVLSGCPYCSAEAITEIELPTDGALWVWTAVTAAPPGYEGEVPFGFGVVELGDELRVVTRLTEPDPAALSYRQPMRLVITALTDQLETYAFEPVP